MSVKTKRGVKKRPQDYPNVHARISVELKKGLTRVAAEEHRTVSGMVAELIRRGLERKVAGA